MKDLEIKPKRVEIKTQKTKPKTGENPKPHKLKKSQFYLIITVVGLLLLLSLFVVRPNIAGLGVYDGGVNASSIEDLQSDLSNIKSNLDSYSNKSSVLADTVSKLSDELSSCVKEKEALRVEMSDVSDRADSEVDTMRAQRDDVQSNLNTANEDLVKKDEELTKLKEDHSKLVENVAKSICCKAKVDNSAISGYEVVDDKLRCVESGGEPLSC